MHEGSFARSYPLSRQSHVGCGRAYSHRIPLAGLKCLSEKRRLEMAARLVELRDEMPYLLRGICESEEDRWTQNFMLPVPGSERQNSGATQYQVLRLLNQNYYRRITLRTHTSLGRAGGKQAQF